MRKSICGSLTHLSASLYSSPVHFLHELLQNAEDNTYAPGVDAAFELVLQPDGVLVCNNEQGFRPKDVLSLCSVAVSTKVAGQHIGQKGLGFKSVFAATDSPHLLSEPWQFKFAPGRDEVASYITPVWLEDMPAAMLDSSHTAHGKTRIWLPLKSSLQDSTFLDKVAAAFDPVSLLNMRKIRRFAVHDLRSGSLHKCFKLTGGTEDEIISCKQY